MTQQPTLEHETHRQPLHLAGRALLASFLPPSTRVAAIALSLFALVAATSAEAELLCWRLDPSEDQIVARVQPFTDGHFYTIDGYLSGIEWLTAPGDGYQLPLSGTISRLDVAIFGSDSGLILGAEAANDFEEAFEGHRQCQLTARLDDQMLEGPFTLSCGEGLQLAFEAEGTMLATACDLDLPG